MKVLYAAPIRLPTEKAHGIQIMETCAALGRAGADIELLVTDRKTPITENPFDYYHIASRFKIMRLHAPDTVAHGRFGYLWYVLLFGLRATHYARRAQADVVYTRDPITFSLLTLLGIRPIAWEVHTAHSGVARSFLKRALGIIPITRGLAAWYLARGVPETTIHAAPDSVDLETFSSLNPEEARRSLRNRLSLSEDAKIALYVGSFGLYAWKGVDVAARAASHAPEILWLFVGGTDEECKKLEGEAPDIRTLPRVRRSEIPQLLVGADVLLLPNKSGDPASERDTSPMKLFEYMASGVPIVASDIPSLREVLDESTAFLVQPNDSAGLAARVRDALTKTQEAREKASKATAEAAKYTWDARAEGIIAFLERRINHP